jgi:hypothetical protein
VDGLSRIVRLFRRETRRTDRRRRQSGRVFHLDIIHEQLPVFGVSSKNYWRYPNLTYQSANRFPSQLYRLLHSLELVGETKVVSVETFAAETEPSADAARLGQLFAANGSDKTTHGYHLAYAAILHRLSRNGVLTVLEVGLGTSAPELVSSMGKKGVPGASLRAFRDFLPGSGIYGADVDASILFQEEGIKTALLDQTRPESFDQMAEALGTDRFDLIVDDGLHSVEANMNTLLFALAKLNAGGWAVIEDIPEQTVIVWQSIVGLLNRAGFKARLVKAHMAYLVVAERR